MTFGNKILIIDDDPQVHKLLETLLVPKKYVVESEEDSTRAWEKILRFRPDLIVLDVMMPGLSGIDLCQKIRNDDSLKKTVILMLSAKDSQTDRIKGLSYGADDYATKPFHVATLVHKIEHMLGGEIKKPGPQCGPGFV